MSLTRPTRPEPIIQARPAFNPFDMEQCTLQRMERLAALFERRAWLEEHRGDDLDILLGAIVLHQTGTETFIDLNALMESLNDPLTFEEIADAFLETEHQKELLISDEAETNILNVNFLDQFENLYQGMTDTDQTLRLKDFIMWQQPSNSKRKPDDEKFNKILAKLNEALERHKSGEGSMGFDAEIIPKNTEATLAESSSELSAGVEPEGLVADAEQTAAILENTETSPTVNDEVPPEEALASSKTIIESEEQLELALKANLQDIQRTLHWQWDKAPVVSQCHIGVHQFLELLRLGEERMKILNWDETNVDQLRQNRKAWFANKAKMERIMFSWPSSRQTVFLNRLSVKKALLLYDLRKLRRKLLLLWMHWPLAKQQQVDYLQTVQRGDRLINFILG